jgi:hypothetical protein
MVYVAGFGMRVVSTREIFATLLGAQLFEPQSPAIIEYPQSIIPIAKRFCSIDRAFENLAFFVVGADEHVDERGLSVTQEAPRSASRLRDDVRVRTIHMTVASIAAKSSTRKNTVPNT